MWNASYVHGASYDSTQAKIFFQLRQARGETRDDTTELDRRALLMLLHPSRIRVSTRSPCPRLCENGMLEEGTVSA